MTAIGAALGGLVTVATGISLVWLLTGSALKEEKSQVTITVCLGLAVGLVLTSCTHFVWQELCSAAPGTFLLADVGLLLPVVFALALGHARGRAAVAPSANTLMGQAQPTVAMLLLAAAALAAALDGGTFALEQRLNRGGQWDALAIWNLKARFLLRAGPHWSDAIDPALLSSHPDYPLLLSLTIARLWRYAGSTEATFVPMVAAATFTTASVVLLGAGVAQVRGRAQGAIAALALLAMPHFIEVGAWQYADVPLAFFELAAVVCAMLAFRREEQHGLTYDGAGGTWTVAGLCAGAALWTKNEAAFFVAAFLIAIVSVGLLRDPSMRVLRRLSSISFGLLPAVVTLLAFKLQHPFPNDILAAFDRTTARRLFDPDRHAAVLYHLKQVASTSSDRIPTFLMLVYAAVAAGRTVRGPSFGASERTALAASALCLVLVAAGLYSTYLITPHPIAWQVANSAERLWLQLLPSVLFVIFVALPPAETVLGSNPR